MIVAALYVDLKRGPYANMPGVMPIGLPKDARLYDAPFPVVAHPPCAAWGTFSWRHVAGSRDGERDCAIRAVEQVRKHGGVLEHPAGSKLWAYENLPKPGEGYDEYGGYTIQVSQVNWGHMAEKRTWLYIVGVDPDKLPPLPPRREPTHVVEPSGRSPSNLPRMPKSRRHVTPDPFAAWLVEVARRVNRQSLRKLPLDFAFTSGDTFSTDIVSGGGTVEVIPHNQAVAIRDCIESPCQRLVIERGFPGSGLRGTINKKTAIALQRRRYGHIESGRYFVLADEGLKAYRKHKEKLNMENNEVVVADTSTPKRARKNGEPKGRPELYLMTPNSEPYEMVDVYPEDVEIPADKNHPLYDRRAAEPLDQEIKNSIEMYGLREPPKVRRKPGTEDEWEIVDGRTRLRAAREINRSLELAGRPKKKIRVQIVLATSDATAAFYKHLYNEERNQRDALGKCEGMVELLAYGYQVSEVASMFHVSDKTVQRAKKIVSSSDELKEALKESKITLVQALELARRPADEQPQALESLLKDMKELEDYHKESGKKKKEEESAEEPKKRKIRKTLPWKKVEPIWKGIRSVQFDDKKTRHTDADVANFVTLTMNFLGGGGDKAKKQFEEALEAIGFSLTPEEG